MTGLEKYGLALMILSMLIQQVGFLPIMTSFAGAGAFLVGLFLFYYSGHNVQIVKEIIYCIHGIPLKDWCGTCEHETGRQDERLLPRTLKSSDLVFRIK